jgi:formate-dependent phosphoribosylglycinamide formyltransferase (GAR transformylase)/GNAT superfamily N-acetyltransferase
MKRQVLFVFGNQACVPGDPLLAAKQLGCETMVVGRIIPCGLPADLVDRFEKINLSEPDNVVDMVRSFHRFRPLHAVVGYDDQAVPVVARIAEELGLPGNPVESADAARDKVLMKKRFKTAGLPISPFHLAAEEEDAIAWANRIGYPVVVKPVRGSASQGVIRADCESELRQAYRRLRRIVRNQGLDTGGRSDAEQLVEGYIDGDEYSVEFLIQEGEPHAICEFEKPIPLHGPFFEETIYVTPTRLSPEGRANIRQLAIEAVKALGLRSGPAHCEIRLSNDGPFVLEIGARVIGGACSRVFRHVLEEDIHSYVLRLALGDKVRLPQQKAGAAGAMMLPIPGEGRLISVRGLDKAQNVGGIQDVILTADPGDLIIPFPEQSCYVGFLTAKADTSEEVERALTMAASAIEMDLQPIECECWSREIEDQRSYQPPAKYGVKTLDDYEFDEARKAVLPIVASANFGELPPQLSLEEAEKCIRWLEDCNKGETSPSFWLIADGGAALGSVCDNTCYVSCLSVVPDHRHSGLGTALMRTMMSIFARRGQTRMEVIVDPREPGSSGLFRRLGFAAEVSGEQTCCAC